MQWEYCAIIDVDLTRKAATDVQSMAVSEERVLTRRSNTWSTMAMLGDEGWELVGCVMTPSGYQTMYFKRPKSEA